MEPFNVPPLGDKELEDQRTFKITLLNVNKSASLGIWLVSVPLYFILCLAMKSFFRIDLHFHEVLVPMLASLNTSVFSAICCFMLFIVAPLVAILINALAIMHFSVNKVLNEIHITIKLNWKSILMICIAGVLVSIAGVFYLKYLSGILFANDK